MELFQDFVEDERVIKSREEGRESHPILQDAEFAKLLMLRVKQLDNNDPSIIEEYNIPSNKYLKTYNIAKDELLTFPEKFPHIVVRELPSGKTEYWGVYEFENLDDDFF